MHLQILQYYPIKNDLKMFMNDLRNWLTFYLSKIPTKIIIRMTKIRFSTVFSNIWKCKKYLVVLFCFWSAPLTRACTNTNVIFICLTLWKCTTNLPFILLSPNLFDSSIWKVSQTRQFISTNIKQKIMIQMNTDFVFQ